MSIDVYRLEEIREEIEMLREEAMGIVSDVGDNSIIDQAYRGWNASIEKALSPSNQWMGGLSMDTLEETIEACEALNEDEEVAA